MALQRKLGPFLAGILAALAGTAVGHLVAALLVPASSPVLAVGTAVINLTPTPVKVWAVRELGSADKPVLVGSVLVGTLLLAGVAGVLARRRFVVGATLLVILVTAAGAAAVVQPAAGLRDALPAVATALTGLAVLALLLRGPSPREAIHGGEAPSRRAFLITAGSVAGLAALAAGTGQWVVRARNRISDLGTARVRRDRCRPCPRAWISGTTASAPSSPRARTSTASTPT